MGVHDLYELTYLLEFYGPKYKRSGLFDSFPQLEPMIKTQQRKIIDRPRLLFSTPPLSHSATKSICTAAFKGRKTTVGMINANPVVHEWQEDTLDALDVFDMVPQPSPSRVHLARFLLFSPCFASLASRG